MRERQVEVAKNVLCYMREREGVIVARNKHLHDIVHEREGEKGRDEVIKINSISG